MQARSPIPMCATSVMVSSEGSTLSPSGVSTSTSATTSSAWRGASSRPSEPCSRTSDDAGVLDVVDDGDRLAAGVLGRGDDDLERDLGGIGERQHCPRRHPDEFARVAEVGASETTTCTPAAGALPSCRSVASVSTRSRTNDSPSVTFFLSAFFGVLVARVRRVCGRLRTGQDPANGGGRPRASRRRRRRYRQGRS